MPASYVEDFLRPLRLCLNYKPTFGTGRPIGDLEFIEIYGEDFFYSAVGLSTHEIYVAHKAAGGLTSFYRQLGIACEVLIRSVLIHELGIPQESVNWNYILASEGSKDSILTLDARVAPAEVPDEGRREIIRNWLLNAAESAGIPPNIASELKGAVFEVRQGYKSADSKRQNADLRFGIHALKSGYLPCVLVFSGQVSEVVIRRYRHAGLFILMGSSRPDINMDTRDFFRDVIGWDLVKWLEVHGDVIRSELSHIIRYLIS